MKKHIIVIRNDQIGDMALSSPLFQKIKEVWPDSILTVIASSISLQLAKLIVPVDHCILDFKQTFRTTLIKSLLFTVKELKKLNIDMIIFARMDPFYVYAAFFAGIKVRVGDKNNVLLNPLLTQKVNVCWNDFSKHEVDQQIRLLSFFTNNLSVPQVSFLEENEKEKNFLDCWELKSHHYIVIHASYGKGNRAWFPQRYANLIDKIIDEGKYKVALTGAGDDHLISDVIEKSTKNSFVNLVGKTSISELLYTIKHAELVIGAETGPLHLAAMFRRPIISISPTKYTRSFRWGPFATNHVVVKKNSQCNLICNTYRNQCDKPYCIDSIKVEEIFQSIEYLLNQHIFPKNRVMYWLKTNASIAIHVTQLEDEMINDLKLLVELLDKAGITNSIVSTNKSLSSTLHEHFNDVSVASIFNIRFWVNMFAIKHLTVWHFNDNSLKIWAMLIKKIVSLRIDVEPLVVISKFKQPNTVKSLLQEYINYSNLLSQK